MIRFSVLMAVYAKEQPGPLAQSLQSVLIDQTHLPDEVVLVCDGPLTPELDAVIAEYQRKCSFFKVYRLPENGGLGNALRFGLTQCSNEWIARMDSDDVSAPNRFQTQIEYLTSHPEVDVLGTAIDEFNDDWHAPTRRKILPKDHESICKLCKLRNPMNHVTVMFRRQRILDCGSYIPQKYTEDYFLWVRVILSGARMANLDECLVHVRIGNGMASRRSSHAYIGSWKKLSNYMLRNKMINGFEYVRNMIAIVGFVYTPVKLKQWIYSHLLRR